MKKLTAQIHSQCLRVDSEGEKFLMVFLSFKESPLNLYTFQIFDEKGISQLQGVPRFEEVEVLGVPYQISPSEHIFVGRLL